MSGGGEEKERKQRATVKVDYKKLNDVGTTEGGGEIRIERAGSESSAWVFAGR